MNQFSIQIHGESGMGLESMGELLMACLRHHGLYLVSERTYPSLIKGGHACVHIMAADAPVRSLSAQADLVVALGKEGLVHAEAAVSSGGVVVLSCDRWQIADPGFMERLAGRQVQCLDIEVENTLRSVSAGHIFANMLALSWVVRLLDLDKKYLVAQVTRKFARKPIALETNVACINVIYAQDMLCAARPLFEAGGSGLMLVDGNTALALGAIHAGVRAYYAYPMSPSSSILSYLARVAPQTGMIIKQAEDEITAVQMALGSMHAGTRALTATSGGGFDLMTETVSLSGMIETPLVIAVAQRPGPATGLPTWTAQGDLLLAIHAGHGEYSRLVMSVSDPSDAFVLIQQAFNLAELVQIPVILLTEKTIAERVMTVPVFAEKTVAIERGLVSIEEIASQTHRRFAQSGTGVSPRWLPGTAGGYYHANGDEHDENGMIDESESAQVMTEKRLRKQDYLLSLLPGPEIFGVLHTADIVVVGFGSTKNAVLDAMPILIGQGVRVAYIHFSYLFPLKPEIFAQLDPSRTLIAESNLTGQFAQVISSVTGFVPEYQYLQKNGRSMEAGDIISFVEQHYKAKKPKKIQL
jgi:2-oxoglutarate/2-oxoacid ferredoxin oxidoreductase subunit alpha